MEKHGFSSHEIAENFVRESDQLRREFVESLFGLKWDSVSAFDLIIDTGKISPDMAVDWLEEEIHRIGISPAPGMPSAQTIQIDKVLERTVDEILHPQAA
jgi:hypothetical protein